MPHRLHRLGCLLVSLSLAACATPRTESPAIVAETGPTVVTSSAPTPQPGTSTRRGPRTAPDSTALPSPEPSVADVPAKPPVEDLLERLRAGYGFPRADHAAIAQQADWYARHPAYLDRVLTRARPYLPHVAAEIEARGLPAELAFLPVIESAFDPFAYSHGRAAGMWQFIPSTGKRFGLKQNWWYDGRRDVVESTRAALDYLQYLHDMFEGDWLLAVAAYNCGEGTVGRAIRNNRAAGRPTDFWSLRLPAETRGYLPRLLGLADVIATPDKYELELPSIPDTQVFVAVELDGQIDLAVAAELAGIELAALQSLNPGFNRWATDPEGPHRLQLPLEVAEDFTVALAALDPSERVRWHRHQVRPGDTLGALARRYKTTVAVVRSVNDLSGTQIRVGSHLMVPTSTRSITDYPLSADNRLASTQQRERAGRVRSEHTVRNGDSLWSISRRHNVGVRELAAWNGMAPGDTLSVGRTLVVWQPGATGSARSAVRPPAAAAQLRKVNYTVQRGDSLYRIANNFRVSVNDIKRWNRLDGRKHLQPGQRLILHVDVITQSGG